MTPLQQIKEGIQSGDWQLVMAGYESMTGDTIQIVEQEEDPHPYKYRCSNCGEDSEFKKERKRCPNCKKHKLIALEWNQQNESQTESVDSYITQTRPSNQTTTKEQRTDEEGRVQARREPINFNRICNSMQYYDDRAVKKDPDFGTYDEQIDDKRPLKIGMAERNRPKATKVKVTCTECEKTFHVAPILARETFVCDSCSKNIIKGLSK